MSGDTENHIQIKLSLHDPLTTVREREYIFLNHNVPTLSPPKTAIGLPVSVLRMNF